MSTDDSPQSALDVIAEASETFGWDFDRLDSLTFRTFVRASLGVYPVLLRVSQHWVVAVVNPVVPQPEDGFGPAARRMLAFSNHLLNMVKIGLDEDDDVFMTAELPVEGFTPELLKTALSTLGAAAEQLFIPLRQAILIDEGPG